jgi:hypothetical protein
VTPAKANTTAAGHNRGMNLISVVLAHCRREFHFDVISTKISKQIAMFLLLLIDNIFK